MRMLCQKDQLHKPYNKVLNLANSGLEKYLVIKVTVGAAIIAGIILKNILIILDTDTLFIIFGEHCIFMILSSTHLNTL